MDVPNDQLEANQNVSINYLVRNIDNAGSSVHTRNNIISI